MSHQIRAALTDLNALAAALKDLQWYTGPGGYIISEATVTDGTAVWSLAPRPVVAAAAPVAVPAPALAQRRSVVEPGDKVVVETKVQQLNRRFDGMESPGVEGTVFRALTRGPHPHGMKVELRDGTVGRVRKNLTAPGAGEPSGRR